MMTDAFRTPEYCAACHKVSLPPVINDYRWLRGQDEFDFWDDSGVSRNASRTFYLPDVRRICQDCHMPPEPAPLGDLAADNGLLRSHRFTAVNTALPFLRGDTATLRRIETFLQDEKLSVDIFALAAGPGRATTMDFRNSGANLTPGRTVTVDVVVRNRGVGHTFPGGTNDSNEGWLEFTLLDADGVVVAQSGHILPDGRLDAMAHVFNTVALDGNSNPVLRRNAQDIRAIAYANVIGPGTARIAHYEFPVPARFAGDSLTVRARLLWRKFNRPFTEFAFASNREAFRSFEAVPSLPITEIAVDKVVIRVGRNAPIDDDRVTSPADWTRFNDYGIGLLLEGDTRRARQAFRRVAELRPNEVDGELNLARAALSDGNLSEAYEHLQRAEEIEPGNPRVAWVWANVTQEDGRYDRAETAYRRVLEAFPGDRAAWRNLGRTLYLAGEYEAAIEALARVLAIDPEDRIAHYHTMLSYRALGRDDAADLAERAYEFYQIDESAQQITRRFLLENPGANVMSQRIRTHRVELEP
ncbi:MAG: tetratricopeptide repeat protein [Gemmatimonadales bacterium]